MLMSTEEVRSKGDIEPRREDEAIIGVQSWQNSNEEKCKQWRQQWRRKSDSKNSVSVREVEVKEIREMKIQFNENLKKLTTSNTKNHPRQTTNVKVEEKCKEDRNWKFKQVTGKTL